MELGVDDDWVSGYWCRGFGEGAGEREDAVLVVKGGCDD